MTNRNIDGYISYELLKNTVNIISCSSYRDKFVIKGGIALISRLLESNYPDLFRATRDIDIHCSSKEVWDRFCTDIEAVLNNNNLGYNYKLVKRRSDLKPTPNSDSLGLVLKTLDGLEFTFSIDMNVKPDSVVVLEFSPILQMNTYSSMTMLSDKIVVVSSEKIYRRIKDLYDIAVLSSLSNYSLVSLKHILSIRNDNLNLVNMLVPANFDKLDHAYSLFRGIQSKPDFRALCHTCSLFLEPLYLSDTICTDLVWDRGVRLWRRV